MYAHMRAGSKDANCRVKTCVSVYVHMPACIHTQFQGRDVILCIN